MDSLFSADRTNSAAMGHLCAHVATRTIATTASTSFAVWTNGVQVVAGGVGSHTPH